MSGIIDKTVPYLCECGCEQYTKWSDRLNRWRRVCAGHSYTNVYIPPPDPKDAPLCLCGCLEPVLWDARAKQWNEYIYGHHSRTKEHKEQFSNMLASPGMREKLNSRNTKRLKELWQDPEYRTRELERLKEMRKRNRIDPEKNVVQDKKSSERLKALWKTKEFREMRIEFCRQQMIERWKNPDRKQAHQQQMFDLWNDPVLAQQMLTAPQARPNKLEQLFDTITSDRIRYVGDGSEWRTWPNGRNKNPDFMIDGKHRVLEIWGDYWHRDDDPFIDIEMWHRIGYECLIIWEHQIHENQAAVLDLVSSFAGFDARATCSR